MQRRLFLLGSLSTLAAPFLASASTDPAGEPHLARITFYHPRVQPDGDPRQRRITVRLLSGERKQIWLSRACLINGTVRLSEKNGGHLITAGTKHFWMELDPEKFPHGQACKGDPVIPFKTVAADPRHYPYGCSVFIPMFDKISMPDGSVHDGLFTVNDVGGAVKGRHLDLAVRNREDYLALAAKLPWKQVKNGHGLWVQVVG